MRSSVLVLLTWQLAALGVAAQTIDAKAPDFSLPDTTGVVHKLSDLKGKFVVLEWTGPDCPYVKRHYKNGEMQDRAAKWTKQGVVWLAVDSDEKAPAETIEAWRKEKNVAYPILLDPTGEVGHAYGAETTPHVMIVKDGVRLYDGAVDDGPRGKATVNYIDQALTELLAGKPVSMPKTEPYG